MGKRLKLYIKLPLIFLIMGIFTQESAAALIRSVGTGNWNTAATWDLGRVPADGDEIIIDVGHTITINSVVTLNNVTIAVRGILRFYRQWLPPLVPIYGELILDVNSLVVIESGGSIVSESILSGNNVISVGGTPVWDGSDGTIGGPSFIDDSGVNPGQPPGYIPLPIELISFNATLSGESILITWATATELNNAYFTIERSEDGITWSEIGEMDGAGNSTVRIDYEFYDTRPIPGLLYYRLKQTDFDGQFEYFKAAVISYAPENLFRVYPNPSTGPLTITTSGELTNAEIFMYDVNGKSISIPVNKNKHQAFLDVSGLRAGVYVLEIVYPESRLSERIIKQ